MGLRLAELKIDLRTPYLEDRDLIFQRRYVKARNLRD